MSRLGQAAWAAAKALGVAHGFAIEFPLADRSGWRVSRTTEGGCRQIGSLPADIVGGAFRATLISWQPLRECTCAGCEKKKADHFAMKRDWDWGQWRERIARRKRA